jgi:hypothetical protein
MANRTFSLWARKLSKKGCDEWREIQGAIAPEEIEHVERNYADKMKLKNFCLETVVLPEDVKPTDNAQPLGGHAI